VALLLFSAGLSFLELSLKLFTKTLQSTTLAFTRKDHSWEFWVHPRLNPLLQVNSQNGNDERIHDNFLSFDLMQPNESIFKIDNRLWFFENWMEIC
jgi:hypothetical protein